MTGKASRVRATRRRSAFGLLGAVALLACSAASALAESASVHFRDTSGREDPVYQVGRTMSLEGNSATPKRLYVRARPPGGAPCAPSAASDTGDALSYEDGVIYLTEYANVADFYGRSVNGNFAISEAGRWSGPTGTLMFCFWLAADDDDAASPYTQTVTFRQSTGSVSPSISPFALLTGQDATVTLSGSTEAPGELYAKVRRAGGAGCAPTYQADTGSELTEGVAAQGAFAHTVPFSTETPGEYLLCAWLTHRESSELISGPQPASFTVTKPCRVPKIKAGTKFSTVSARLKSAGCAVGARRSKASRKYKRGRVIRLASKAGTSLPSGAQIGLVVSAGPPCVVPRARRDMRLSTAKARLRSAGCRPGKVRRVNSARPAGTLVRFSPRAGSRLAPRARITIVLARG